MLKYVMKFEKELCLQFGLRNWHLFFFHITSKKMQLRDYEVFEVYEW